MSLPPAKRIRVEDYLAFERAAETKHEYMDGIVYPWGDPDHPLDPDVVLGLRPEPRSAMAGGSPRSAMAGGSRTHSLIKVNLTIAIGTHLLGSPCRLYDSDLRVRPDGDHYFYPDLFVVCADNPGADTDTEVDNPTLVIEVLSPSTEPIDRVSKLRRYAHAPSLREYVLINSRFPGVEVRRREDEQWLSFTYEPGEIVYLESIKLDLDFETIYRHIQWAAE
jgi:Uma2 family endonuclease